MNDRVEPQQANNPAKAFNDLRSEVVVLRRTVEDWREALIKDPPPNYAEQLTKIGNALRHIVDQVKDIKKFPDDAAKSLREAGNSMFHQARSKVDEAEGSLRREEGTLRSLIGTVRDQHQQRRWLIRAGIGGLATGMVLFYVLARALPFGVDTYVAAAIVGENRWDAGLSLLQAASAESWQRLVSADRLVRANADKVEACRAAAAKSKKDENCSISVPPGG